jgi:hypothetical protein
MQATFTFLASRNGRITRLVVGVILLIIGLAIGFNVGALFGWILIVISLFPIVGAALDICFFAPFAGMSSSGKNIRAGITVDDPMAEITGVLVAKVDEKNQALLDLMRYWLFGTFAIVSSAVYSYAWMMAYDGDRMKAFREAWLATYPIIGAIVVLCSITYLGYWWFVTRIRMERQAATESPGESTTDDTATA